MTASRQQAVENALKVNTYPVGMCARFTREQYGVPALGDFDGDGDADAWDMWQASRLKNPGDKNPPAGAPVFWSGGSKGHGHAAVSLGGGRVRSTDRPIAGRVGTTTIDDITRSWGMTYLGWTEDLYGHLIEDGRQAERDALRGRIAKKRKRRGELKGQLAKLRARLKRLS